MRYDKSVSRVSQSQLAWTTRTIAQPRSSGTDNVAVPAVLPAMCTWEAGNAAQPAPGSKTSKLCVVTPLGKCATESEALRGACSPPNMTAQSVP